MKNIQWYPGHMAKAMRLMEESIKLCDAVVFVLDARAPASSFNPRLLQIAGNKPVLYLFNKADMADGQAEILLKTVKESGKHAVLGNATAHKDARALQAAMAELVREKSERNREKGVTKPLRFLVAGIPNTGKSTLINLLAGSKKAVTGDKAGVTRKNQWVRCGAFELLDTPGTMPPSCENQTLARRLAYLGGINDDILEFDEIALCLLEEMAQKYPDRLCERYGIEGGEPLEMLNKVCARMGFVLRGNEYDYERGERALIDDLRKGRLGRVCFDGAEDLVSAGLV